MERAKRRHRRGVCDILVSVKQRCFSLTLPKELTYVWLCGTTCRLGNFAGLILILVYSGVFRVMNVNLIC